jgi:ABC-2 type transport system ATP-binding protein
MHAMSGRPLARRIDETLEVVGLGGKQRTTGFALSSGMRARLQVARAILHEPEVLILDEPTGAIDPLGAREIIDMVRQVAAATGTAVLLSSHRIEEIEELSERVMVLHHGRVAFGGDLGMLRSTWAEPVFELGFTDGRHTTNATAALCGVGLHAVVENPLKVRASAATAGDVVAALGDLAPLLVSLDQRRMTLLEVLARLLSDAPGPTA